MDNFKDGILYSERVWVKTIVVSLIIETVNIIMEMRFL